MPRLRYASAAVRGLERLREFLQPKNPLAARRAGQAIQQALRVLCQQPQIGRPIEDMPEAFREWVIDFGDSGYVARYCIEPDAIIILAIRHQREVGG